MIINTKLLYQSAKMPVANADGISSTLFACLVGDFDGFKDIEPHSTRKISTGIEIDIPAGYVALLCPDSTLAAEQGLDIAGGFTLLSAMDNGELFVMLHNDSDYVRTINEGQAIARIIVMPATPAEFA